MKLLLSFVLAPLLLLAAASSFAQTTPAPQVQIICPPALCLAFPQTGYIGVVAIDADGGFHPAQFMGVAFTLQPDGSYVMEFTAPVPVDNEVPAATPIPGVWKLAHNVAGTSVKCYRNGMRQRLGVDFTSSANALSSSIWQAGDNLVCDYMY